MNVVGASKRERIVVSRLGSIEENQNQKIEEVEKKRKRRKMVLSEVGIEN